MGLVARQMIEAKPRDSIYNPQACFPRLLLSRAVVRKAVFAAHLWVGIALSVWFVLLGLTGALLVFKPQLDALLNPRPVYTAPVSPRRAILSPDAALHAAQTAYPNVAFNRLEIPVGASGLYKLRFGKEKTERDLFINPYTGASLGVQAHKAGFSEWVLELHKALLLGKAGEQINGISALLLVGLLASGIYLWWPANAKQWPQRFSVKLSASPKRLLFDLHNAFGIYSLPILLVVAMTGAVFIYKKPVERGVYALTGTPYPSQKEEKERYYKQRIPYQTSK